jgi:hypothetical protein
MAQSYRDMIGTFAHSANLLAYWHGFTTNSGQRQTCNDDPPEKAGFLSKYGSDSENPFRDKHAS